MFGTENHMQVVSQILATLLKRLRSHRTKNEVCQPAQSVADLPPPIPLVKIRYEPFILPVSYTHLTLPTILRV